MNHLKIALAALLLSISSIVSAQEVLSVENMPETKDEFIESEPNVLATIAWLENTPIDEQEDERSLQSGFLIVWLTNSPTVTIELNGDVVTFTKKNAELLILYMAGYTKYVLENEYSTDVAACSLSGVRSAMAVYKTGKLKKDKEMEKLIALEEQGKLEAWVKEQSVKK